MFEETRLLLMSREELFQYIPQHQVEIIFLKNKKKVIMHE
ncbi:hypothetical protein T283_12220 [Listeria monocytogenes N53-1]|nr:hypothetical protein T283_12220 [Listeria monocytogenes N53-1]